MAHKYVILSRADGQVNDEPTDGYQLVFSFAMAQKEGQRFVAFLPGDATWSTVFSSQRSRDLRQGDSPQNDRMHSREIGQSFDPGVPVSRL